MSPSPTGQHIAARAVLDQLMRSALRRVDPLQVLPQWLPEPPRSPTARTIVIGAGKGAARMALALERAWPGKLQGLVVTRYGHGEPCERIGVVEAGHPVPDAAGLAAAQRTLSLVQGLTADDLVIALVSGGGSSLLTLPRPGVSLDDKQAVNRALLHSGASIHEMNAVRRALSAIKGGALAQACGPARVVTLVVSDVADDDPAVVSSGPTVPPPLQGPSAAEVVRRYGLALPPHVMALLDGHAPAVSPACGPREVHVIATARDALDAAVARARELDIDVMDLGARLEGEAREVGTVHAGIARHLAASRAGARGARPIVLLSGGETTVTVRGKGRGGRNAEFLLGFAVAAQGLHGVHALAIDTDGIDGSETNAGAWADGHSVSRAAAQGWCARECLQRNDAYTAFERLGDLLVTGPTRTNVNDFRAVLIEPAHAANTSGGGAA